MMSAPENKEIILAREEKELERLREIIKNKEIELHAIRDSYWQKFKIWEADTKSHNQITYKNNEERNL